MRYIYFDNSIDNETITNLVSELQETEQETRLYFSTTGGEITAMKYLIDFLNSRKDTVTLVLVDEICSAGTLLLTDFQGKMEMQELDFILFHCCDILQYGQRKGTIDSKTLKKQTADLNKEVAQAFLNKGWLTYKQAKKFLKGEDIVLYKKDIKRWTEKYNS